MPVFRIGSVWTGKKSKSADTRCVYLCAHCLARVCIRMEICRLDDQLEPHQLQREKYRNKSATKQEEANYSKAPLHHLPLHHLPFPQRRILSSVKSLILFIDKCVCLCHADRFFFWYHITRENYYFRKAVISVSIDRRCPWSSTETW